MSQKKSIMEMFQKNETLTASQAHRKYRKYSTTPITSIRRAFTELKLEGKVEDTGSRTTGIYGSPEIVWRLPKKQLTLGI